MEENLNKFENNFEENSDGTEDQNFGSNRAVNPEYNADDNHDTQGGNKKALIPFLLLFVGLGFFVFWYNGYQIRKTVEVEIPEWVQAELTGATEEEQITELKESDTDFDGLTDYQELYQFGTSIFLEDTDSDGYSDQEEVLSGNDPLCPTGEDCSLLKLITPRTRLSEVVQDVASNPKLEIQDAVLIEFKKFLLDNGITQEELDDLTDEELLQYLAILSEAESDNINNVSSTPEQMRNFLLEQPDLSDEDIAHINELSDEELMAIQDLILGEEL